MSCPAIGTQSWRKQTRSDAIRRRVEIDPQRKRSMDISINQRLEAALLDVLADAVVGFCWPFKAEFDQRFVAHKLRTRGVRTALPIVVQKAHPLIFREWWPGATTAPGVYDIPVPVDTPQLQPDVVLPPLNAFDGGGFRLGYGGGFFDRTLAALQPQPIAIGIGYEEQRIESIFPRQHDIPMDFIVTEANLYRRADDRIVPLHLHDYGDAVRELLRRRRLPNVRAARAARLV